MGLGFAFFIFKSVGSVMLGGCMTTGWPFCLEVYEPGKAKCCENMIRFEIRLSAVVA